MHPLESLQQNWQNQVWRAHTPHDVRQSAPLSSCLLLYLADNASGSIVIILPVSTTLWSLSCVFRTQWLWLFYGNVPWLISWCVWGVWVLKAQTPVWRGEKWWDLYEVEPGGRCLGFVGAAFGRDSVSSHAAPSYRSGRWVAVMEPLPSCWLPVSPCEISLLRVCPMMSSFQRQGGHRALPSSLCCLV